MGPKIMFDDHLVRKRAFLDYKKADFIKWLYWIFLKRVNQWFWLKLGNYLDKMGLEIKFDDHQLRKHPFLGYKKADFIK